MKIEEFKSEMERLKKTYGNTKYSDERIGIFFEHLGSLPYDAFKKQVSIFIGEREKAPMVNDFREVFTGKMTELKRENAEKRLEDETTCNLCGNTGSAMFYNIPTGESYVFQCTCKRGEMLRPSFPKQYDGMEKKYASHGDWISGKYQKPKFEKENGKVNPGFCLREKSTHDPRKAAANDF